MIDSHKFEDVALNVLRIEPLTSRTWTVEIQPGGSHRWESVIMTAEDLRALARAAWRIAGPDIQFFAESGTWHKPAGAVRVDCLIQAAGGGGSVALGRVGADGGDGELRVTSFPANEIPDVMEVEIGRGGRGAQLGGVKAGDGADGWALIVTHLAQGTQQ